MQEAAIVVEHLGFRYDKGGPGFEDFSLAVPAGRIFGLLGPNGAGKTTLISLMTGLLRPAEGTIRMLGTDIQSHSTRVRRSFGLVPQDMALYEDLSPLENLEFFGAQYGLTRQVIRRRAEELLGGLGLLEVIHKPVRQFSGGMKRRVNLAIGVVHDPSVVILDEPTVGVDVQTRKAMMGYLQAMNARGATLIYTSHQLSEAEELCQEVALIDRNRLLYQGPMAELLDHHPERSLEAIFLDFTGCAYRN